MTTRIFYNKKHDDVRHKKWIPLEMYNTRKLELYIDVT